MWMTSIVLGLRGRFLACEKRVLSIRSSRSGGRSGTLQDPTSTLRIETLRARNMGILRIPTWRFWRFWAPVLCAHHSASFCLQVISVLALSKYNLDKSCTCFTCLEVVLLFQ